MLPLAVEGHRTCRLPQDRRQCHISGGMKVSDSASIVVFPGSKGDVVKLHVLKQSAETVMLVMPEN